jgi:hypothetical protein
MIPRKTFTDFDDIGLGTQTGDIFFQNDLSISHRDPFQTGGEPSLHPDERPVKRSHSLPADASKENINRREQR